MVEPAPYARTGPGQARDGKPEFDVTRFNEEYFQRFFRACCSNLLLSNSDHIACDDPHLDPTLDVVTLHPVPGCGSDRTHGCWGRDPVREMVENPIVIPRAGFAWAPARSLRSVGGIRTKTDRAS